MGEEPDIEAEQSRFDTVGVDTPLFACRECGVVVVGAGRQGHADEHDDLAKSFDGPWF